MEKRIVGRRGFGGKNIGGGTGERAAVEGGKKVRRVYQGGATDVHEYGAGTHSREGVGIEDACGVFSSWCGENDEVTAGEEVIESNGCYTSGLGWVTDRCVNVHAEGACNLGDAAADFAAAEQTQGPAVKPGGCVSESGRPTTFVEQRRAGGEFLGDTEQQRKGVLGDGVGAEVRDIRYDDALLAGRGYVERVRPGSLDGDESALIQIGNNIDRDARGDDKDLRASASLTHLPVAEQGVVVAERAEPLQAGLLGAGHRRQRYGVNAHGRYETTSISHPSEPSWISKKRVPLCFQRTAPAAADTAVADRKRSPMSNRSKKGRLGKKKPAQRRKHAHRSAPVTRQPSSSGTVEMEPVTGETPSDPVPPLSVAEMGRTMAGLQNLLDKQGFTSLDEAKDFLEKITGVSLDDLDDSENEDPKYRAQKLAYDAMEAPSDRQASRLAREALQVDPDCVDALAIVAELTRSPAKRLRLFEEAVEAGEKSLGAEFFAENKGYFWGIIETRPYMRARKSLADELLCAERGLEAMQHFEELLKLCPDDNMGVRFDLLQAYLTTDHIEQALDLLNRTSEDAGAIWNWGAVLIHYLLRDFAAATRSLEEARKQNPFVEPYLTRKKRMPAQQPDFFAFGKDSEAIVCAHHLVAPWSLHPVALSWLRTGGRPGDGRYCGILTATGK